MKRSSLFTGIFFLFLSAAKAQLQSTKWRGTANMAVPTDVLLSFDKDSTADAFMMPDSVSLALMTFKVDSNIVSPQKVSGSIPCDEAIIGTYKFEITRERLTMHVVTDECIARSHSLDGTYYDRVK